MTDGRDALLAQGFQHFEHGADVKTNGSTMHIVHPVFFAGKGPALLLMHELPGLAQPCINFAKRLMAEGFQVFMPQLVGPVLQAQTFRDWLPIPWIATMILSMGSLGIDPPACAALVSKVEAESMAI